MGHDEKIEIQLDESEQRFIQDRIDAGEFESAEQMVTDLLRRYQRYAAWREDAREKIREGIEAAERGDLIDGDEFFAELEAELLAHAEREERGKRSA